VNSIKQTILTGMIYDRGIGFLGGFNFVFAGFEFIKLIISIAMSGFISGALNNSGLGALPSEITGNITNSILSMFAPSPLKIIAGIISV
ncbi:MAG: hypothetical protein RR806_09105, partial [Oscillospiraceae bacterium]